MKKHVMIIVWASAIAGSAIAAPGMKGDPVNGADVFANRCVRCHNLRLPSNLSESEWKIAMKHMRVRSGLTGKETRDTLAFILESKQ